ncbi:hypothetical protein AQUCO_02700043v1 [Aquilegia coerulea]|uniref:Uncharacterized protein n=1 Tax=Aquilegia coerulea TaxID=218851 RepID=A0A2G5D4W8_AQUCA|nr:hypothetical protein AQUCO_02700043v1 [Aquilegia coerulea]
MANLCFIAISIFFIGVSLATEQNMSQSTILSDVSYYKFVMQWPHGLCTSANHPRCIHPYPYYLCIHGLWPENSGHQNPSVKQLPFNYALISGNILPQLRTTWPSVVQANSNFAFWKHEWDAHGIRSDFDQHTYFARTVHMAHLLNPTLKLAARNIVPGGTYALATFESELQQIYGSRVQLRCKTDFAGARGRFNLWELHFILTFTPTGGYVIHPNNQRSSCNSIVYY